MARTGPEPSFAGAATGAVGKGDGSGRLLEPAQAMIDGHGKRALPQLYSTSWSRQGSYRDHGWTWWSIDRSQWGLEPPMPLSLDRRLLRRSYILIRFGPERQILCGAAIVAL